MLHFFGNRRLNLGFPRGTSIGRKDSAADAAVNLSGDFRGAGRTGGNPDSGSLCRKVESPVAYCASHIFEYAVLQSPQKTNDRQKERNGRD